MSDKESIGEECQHYPITKQNYWRQNKNIWNPRSQDPRSPNPAFYWTRSKVLDLFRFKTAETTWLAS
jgi:hypothetical protein